MITSHARMRVVPMPSPHTAGLRKTSTVIIRIHATCRPVSHDSHCPSAFILTTTRLALVRYLSPVAL